MNYEVDYKKLKKEMINLENKNLRKLKNMKKNFFKLIYKEFMIRNIIRERKNLRKRKNYKKLTILLRTMLLFLKKKTNTKNSKFK